jgi:hypothetical protein
VIAEKTAHWLLADEQIKNRNTHPNGGVRQFSAHSFTDEWVSECKKSQLKIKKPLLNELKIFSKES